MRYKPLLQNPDTQLPLQQSALALQAPPMGAQVWPVVTQLPFWHCAPLQQSASVVHCGELTQTLFTHTRPAAQVIVEQSWPDSGKHDAWH